ncbi:MAG TPA: aquaporin [bacterium]|nr:aquaporin [bacterium]
MLAVGPVSGAHLNPTVTFADGLLGGIGLRDGLAYGLAQIGGAVAGAVCRQPDVWTARRGDFGEGPRGPSESARTSAARTGLRRRPASRTRR